MINFFKSWGSLIIATVALIQPWALALWKGAFRRGVIDIHETGKIEIGFGPLGPTIGLQGTLRAIHQDQFVRSAEITLIRKKDNSSHSLPWGLFRSGSLFVGREQQTSLELPSGFMVTTLQPHRYNIQFYDIGVQGEMQPYLVRVKQAWLEVARTTPTNPAPILGDLSEARYTEFMKSNIWVDAFLAIDRQCHWESGKYLLTLSVNTARPNRSYRRHWTFELSDDDARQLRLNALTSFRESCGRPSQYFFAYPDYRQTVHTS